MAVRLDTNPLWILLHAWPPEFNRYVLRDMGVNVALYVPVGVTGLLAFRRFSKPAVSIGLAIASGAVLSACIEMTQLFVPTRDCSALDLTTNTLGTLLGVVLVVGLESIFPQGRANVTRKPIDRAALTLLICWVLWLWFPLMPVLGRTALSHKLSHVLRASSLDVVALLSAAMVWFAAGSLLHAARLRPAQKFVAISVSLIPAQLFVLERQPALMDLAGAIVGVVLFATCWPHRKARGSLYLKIQAGVFLATIAIRGLAPFRFLPVAGPFVWVPFGGLLVSDAQVGLEVLSEKLFWYGTAIWLLRIAGVRSRYAIAIVATVLLCIEIAQTHLPGRVAEITDPLMAIFVGSGLALVSRRREPVV